MKTIDIISKNDVEKICKSMSQANADFIFEHLNKLRERIELLEQEIKIIKSAL